MELPLSKTTSLYRYAVALLFLGGGCLDSCPSCDEKAPVGYLYDSEFSCREQQPGECADADPAAAHLQVVSVDTFTVRPVYTRPLPAATRYGTAQQQYLTACYLPANEWRLRLYGTLDVGSCKFTFFSLEHRDSYVRELRSPSATPSYIYMSTSHIGTTTEGNYFSQVIRLVQIPADLLAATTEGSVTLTLGRASSTAQIATNLWPYTMLIRAQLPDGTARVDRAERLIDGPRSLRYPTGTRVEIQHEQVYQLDWVGPCERLQNPTAFCTLELIDSVTTVEVNN